MILGQWLRLLLSHWFYEALRNRNAWSVYQKYKRFRRSILKG